MLKIIPFLYLYKFRGCTIFLVVVNPKKKKKLKTYAAPTNRQIVSMVMPLLLPSLYILLMLWDGHPDLEFDSFFSISLYLRYMSSYNKLNDSGYIDVAGNNRSSVIKLPTEGITNIHFIKFYEWATLNYGYRRGSF